MNGFPVIALLVLLPAVGAIVVGLLPKSRRELILPITTAISMLPLAVALYILWEFSAADGATFQFSENVTWYEPWGIGWNVGIDGISLLLIVLTSTGSSAPPLKTHIFCVFSLTGIKAAK